MKPDIVTIPEASKRTGVTAKAIRLLISWGLILDWPGKLVSVKQIRACQVTVAQASRMWGFVPEAGRLKKLIAAERLDVVDPDDRPRKVVVRDVVKLVKEIDNPTHGKKRGG